MSKKDAIRKMEYWLLYMEKVPTIILNSTDLLTGKKLTPFQESRYYAVTELTPWLNREDITKILDNGFPDPKQQPENKSNE